MTTAAPTEGSSQLLGHQVGRVHTDGRSPDLVYRMEGVRACLGRLKNLKAIQRTLRKAGKQWRCQYNTHSLPCKETDERYRPALV